MINYGVDGPKQFHAIAQLTHWEDYRGNRAILVTRTIFGDRDRLTDDWIAKSIAYTIEGPLVSMVAITENQMHFAVGLLNFVEYNFVVVPPGIKSAQIQSLGDVEQLGGKILASASQGIPVPAAEAAAQPK